MTDDRCSGTGLTPLLVEYHEALVEGRAPADALGQQSESPLLRTVACLQALEHIRQEREQQHIETADRERDAADCGADFDLAIAPRRFGRFEVIEELGRGGHGIVYRAFDPVLRRDVALKIPRLEILDSAQHRARFLRESRSIAALNHPNLVPIYESGEVGPVCYLALQYCSGPTLAQWLKANPGLPAEALAATLVAVLAETIEYVHGQGILHRDIKPANVLLDYGGPVVASESDAREVAAETSASGPPFRALPGRMGLLPFTPKLTDFGLAKVLEQPAGDTRTGAVLGTLQYMAPEQADGRTGEIGEAADIYALGAVLYELLTGRPPCCGQTDLETLRMTAEGVLSPPRRVRAGISRDLEAVCLKCLEFEPSRRYSTAGELAADLRRYLSGESVLVRPPGPVGRAARWARRKPIVAGLTLALLFALSAGFAAVLLEWRLAEAHRAASDANLELAHQAIREFHEVLYSGDTYDAPQFQPLRKELLHVGLRYYADLEKQTTQPGIRAEIAEACFHAGIISYASGDKADALIWHGRALPLWRALVRKQPGVAEHQCFLAKTLEQLGLIDRARGRVEQGLEACAEALSIRERLIEDDPDNGTLLGELAESCGDLGVERQKAGRSAEALELLTRSRRIHERLLAVGTNASLHELRLARTLHALAQLASSVGDVAEALDLCAQAARLQEKVVFECRWMPGALADLGQTLHLQGIFCLALQRADEALECQQRSAACFERLADGHPQTLMYRVALANVYRAMGALNRSQGEFSSAFELCDRARAIDERLLGDDPANDDLACYLAAACLELAAIHLARHQPNEALQSCEAAERLYCRLLEKHPASTSYKQSHLLTQKQIADLNRQLDAPAGGIGK